MMDSEQRCRAYIAFSVSMVLKCESSAGHDGWHQFIGATQALDGMVKDIRVAWSDDRKPDA